MKPEDAKLIADLETLEARATKGPWVSRDRATTTGVECEECGNYVAHDGPSIVAPIPPATEPGAISLAIADVDGGSQRAPANAEFIVAARNALPRLIALVRAQDDMLRKCADALIRAANAMAACIPEVKP